MTQDRTNAIAIENLPDGLEATLYQDKQILALRADAISRAAVDSFWEVARLQANYCREHDRPFLMLYQVERITLSPYARQIGIDAIASFSDLNGRIAILFNRSNPLLIVIRTFIMREMARSLPNFAIREFRDQATGMAWLEQALV